MFKRFFSTYAGPADSNVDSELEDDLEEIRNRTAPTRGNELAASVVRYFNLASCPLVRNYQKNMNYVIGSWYLHFHYKVLIQYAYNYASEACDNTC